MKEITDLQPLKALTNLFSFSLQQQFRPFHILCISELLTSFKHYLRLCWKKVMSHISMQQSGFGSWQQFETKCDDGFEIEL